MTRKAFAAGLFNALDVLPPVIDGHDGGNDRRGVIHIELEGVVVRIHQGGWKPVAVVGHCHQFIHQAGNILAGGNTRDRPCKDVIEHQRRNADLGEGAS